VTDDLVVNVATEPLPGLIRPAIEADLAGRAWPSGPEAQIAAAVGTAVRAETSARSTTEAPTSQGKPSLANLGFPDGAGKLRSE
jgi:hypothetical protein